MEKTETKKTGNSKISKIVLITVLLAGSAIGIYKYLESQKYETTDDAQVEGDITPVSARVSGYVDQVYFTDNQPVKKSDTLLILDDRDLKIKVEQSEASLENSKASLEAAKANAASVSKGSAAILYKIQELKILLNNAQTDFNRYQKMLKDGAVTQQQFDKVKTNKETLEQQLAAAKQQKSESDSRIIAAKEQVKVAQSVVMQRQSDLDYAKLQLSYSVIEAPYDGVVSKKNAITGQLIQMGQPICSIVSEENVWVVANFKETQITDIKTGMKVEISVDAYPDKEIPGTVSSFASATGSKFSLIPPDNASGNYVKVVQRVPVKIELDKSATETGQLKPGLSVFVRVFVKN